MEPRVLTTDEAAAMLRYPSAKAFMAAHKEGRFPFKPLPNSTRCRKYWRASDLQRFIDSPEDVKAQSVDHDAIIFGRLKRGEGSREVPQNP